MAINKVVYGNTTLIDLTGDTVASEKMLQGTTAHGANGSAIIGSIPNKAAQIYTPTTTNQTIASGQYLSGTQTIAGDSNLIAENIAKDVTIFGITGTHQGGIDVDDIIIIGDYGLCFNNFTITENTCTSEAGTVSGNTLIAV